ncbi:50S ribosomal protein L25, partial [Gammaproteobacteria bacterium]|nr:50S ribosomal protein L25 [Gammaproteobacteria bacterium]
DVTNVPLGDAIRVTELDLPEGSEIVGLEDGQDQMVVSVNAPKAAEEEPVEDESVEGEEGTDGEPTQGDEPSDDAEGSEES